MFFEVLRSMFNIFSKKNYELFNSPNVNENLIEFNNIKNKGKKWGKIGGIIGIVFGAFFSMMLIANANPITIIEVLGSIIFMIILYFSFKNSATYYAWGFYWSEKQMPEMGGITFSFVLPYAGYRVYRKYRNYDKKIRKEDKDKT